MAIAILYQRDHDARVMRQSGALTTATPWRGLAYDGHHLWASGSGDLTQVDIGSWTQGRTVATTGGETYDCLTYDGEYLWGAVSGNAGIGQITREGQRINFIGSIFGNSPIGIAHDGHFLWALYVNAGSGFYDISQFDPQWLGISKTFSTGIADSEGLAFDGEFLVVQRYPGGVRNFAYFDRSTGALVRSVAEFAAGGDANGFAFDGEYFYGMLAV